MKIGIEVEGRLRGIKTLFMNHEELMQAFHHTQGSPTAFGRWLHTYANQYGASHIYISDHTNQITPHFFGEYIGPFLDMKSRLLVTLEVTDYSESWYELRRQYPSLGFMIHVEGKPSLWGLEPLDQIKFSQETSRGPTVLCATRLSFQRTHPEEFQNDIELPSPFPTPEPT